MTPPICYGCGKSVESEMTGGKIPFRAVCPACLRSLHSCLACRHYKRGAPNDCDVPDIEPVKEKDAPNFCEEFSPLFAVREKKNSVSDIESKLFGSTGNIKKKDPKDLFKD
ncbi:hypothetical protein [Estrella lausannensis]|uniref:Uncharacterized protein n=1 Tax=Estrella lausannensis TaxID=483423 RepID=A0A0H5E2Q5_9BACT|nr:hypothetical protein [Estrella lausannensis]CRX37480.1 Conserved hypothetical protein [Estrella lausannensis]